MKALPTQVEAFNQSLEKNKIEGDAVDDLGDRILPGSKFHSIELDIDGGTNEALNELFFSVQEKVSLTSKLAEIFI